MSSELPYYETELRPKPDAARDEESGNEEVLVLREIPQRGRYGEPALLVGDL